MNPIRKQLRARVDYIRIEYNDWDKSKTKLTTTGLGIMNEWEIDFLLHIQAIRKVKNRLIITSDYPMLVIKKDGGGERVEDYDTNLTEMENKIDEIRSSNAKARAYIKNFPHNYTAYKQMKKEINEEEFGTQEEIN